MGKPLLLILGGWVVLVNSFKFNWRKKRLLLLTILVLFFYALLVIYGALLSNVFLVVKTSSSLYPSPKFQSNVEYHNFPVNVPTFKNYFSASYTDKAVNDNYLQNFRNEIGMSRFLSSDPNRTTNLFNQFLKKADTTAPEYDNPSTSPSEYVYPCLSGSDGQGKFPLPGYNTFNPTARLESKAITDQNIEYHYPGFLADADHEGTHTVYDDIIKSIRNKQNLSNYYNDSLENEQSSENLLTKIAQHVIKNIKYIGQHRLPKFATQPSVMNYVMKYANNDFMRFSTDGSAPPDKLKTFEDFNSFFNLATKQQIVNYLQLKPSAMLDAPFSHAASSLLLGTILGLNGNIGSMSFSSDFFQALNLYCHYFKLDSMFYNNMAFDFPLAYELSKGGLPFVNHVYGGRNNNKIISGVSKIFEQGIIKTLPTYLNRKFLKNDLSLNFNLIPFNPNTDCKYTNINGMIGSTNSIQQNQNTQLWGLPLNDSRIVLKNQRNVDLKQRLTGSTNTNQPTPVLVNKTFVNKYHYKIGSILRFSHSQKINKVYPFTPNDVWPKGPKGVIADAKKFLSFNNMDNSTNSDSVLKIGTFTNGLFYQTLDRDTMKNNPNLSSFDSLSFLYKNYNNMQNLSDVERKSVFSIIGGENPTTYGMHVDDVHDIQNVKIVGVVNNNYYSPIMIGAKKNVDKINWQVDSDTQPVDQRIISSGMLYNAKLTTNGSPDDLTNFCVFNKNGDYTPVGLNGNGKQWDTKKKQFVTASIYPFTFTNNVFDPDESSYDKVIDSYYNEKPIKRFIASPHGGKVKVLGKTVSILPTDEYKILNNVNGDNNENNKLNKSFGTFKGDSTAAVTTMFSHDLFTNAIDSSARLISGVLSILFIVLFLLVIIILTITFRKIVEDNQKIIAILKATGYNNSQIFQKIFSAFLFNGIIAFIFAFFVSVLTAPIMFTSLLKTLNVPPIFSGLVYTFGLWILFFLFFAGAILVFFTFRYIKYIKPKI